MLVTQMIPGIFLPIANAQSPQSYSVVQVLNCPFSMKQIYWEKNCLKIFFFYFCFQLWVWPCPEMALQVGLFVWQPLMS